MSSLQLLTHPDELNTYDQNVLKRMHQLLSTVISEKSFEFSALLVISALLIIISLLLAVSYYGNVKDFYELSP